MLKIENALTMINAQQKGTSQCSDIWMVGEQLKEICGKEPESAQRVAEDLEGGALTLKGCAGKIREKADEEHKKSRGNCVCIPPQVAEGIIRKYFGLPAGEKKKEIQPEIGVLDLADFL